jgi:hypothetical protein
MQLLLPVESWYLLAGHGAHCVPSVLRLPAAHAPQTVIAATFAVPTVFGAWPGSQLSQPVLAALLMVPTGHARQAFCLCALLVWYWPPGHWLHDPVDPTSEK